MRQSRVYRFAFAQLVLKKDRSLWNGTNTVESVSPDDVKLPTHEEIEMEMDRIKKDPTEDNVEEVQPEEH